MKADYLLTFFLNAVSECLDQSSRARTAVEITAISTPFDRVPLYTVAIPSSVEIILLKSSHAVSSSGLFSLGTPRGEARSFQYVHLSLKLLRELYL